MNSITMKLHIDPLILQALKEDISSEDISTNSVMKDYQKGAADLLCKEDGIICGLPVFARTFELLDEEKDAKGVKTTFTVKDGDFVKKGQKL